LLEQVSQQGCSTVAAFAAVAELQFSAFTFLVRTSIRKSFDNSSSYAKFYQLI
jgi:hypothetical protein